MIRGTQKIHWRTRSTDSAPILANTLIDLLVREIAGKGYGWDAKPIHYIFDVRAPRDYTKPVASRKKKVQIGIKVAKALRANLHGNLPTG